MKDLGQKLLSFKDRLINLSNEHEKNYTFLFDSCYAAENIAFMLGGQWDECNSVVLGSISVL